MLLSVSEIRREISQKLPKDAFSPKLQYMLIPLFLSLAILLFSYFILITQHWYLSLFYSVVVGFLYVSFVFFTHHMLHGCVTRSKLLKKLVGQIGFLIFCIPVELWRLWHNIAHHLNTNSAIMHEDPDAHYANLEDSVLNKEKKFSLKKIHHSLLPGSKKMISFFYLFYAINIGVQLSLYRLGKNPKINQSHYKKQKIKLQLQFLAMIFFWISLGYWMGIKNAFFIIIIPMLITNFGIMSHLATNHWLMPLTKINHPLLNSMSLKTLKIFDIIHFNFSHHVEHHIFPTLHWKYYPVIRHYLMENFREYYICPSYIEALYFLYKTPREYKDNNTLYNRETNEFVPIEQIHKKIKNHQNRVISTNEHIQK